MVIFSEPPADAAENMFSIWAEDSTCYNSKSSGYGNCKISSDEKTRIYIVRVTAIDKAGNVGVGECSTIVGKPKYRKRTQIDNYPFFLIARREIVGGSTTHREWPPPPPKSTRKTSRSRKDQNSTTYAPDADDGGVDVEPVPDVGGVDPAPSSSTGAAPLEGTQEWQNSTLFD